MATRLKYLFSEFVQWNLSWVKFGMYLPTLSYLNEMIEIIGCIIHDDNVFLVFCRCRHVPWPLYKKEYCTPA